MSWLKKIRFPLILLVLLTVIGVAAKAGHAPAITGKHQKQLLKPHSNLSQTAFQWVNAPIPEKSDELLFVEESEDDQHHWVLQLTNRQFSICISILFGQPEPGFELAAVPDSGNLPITLQSTGERLSSLQIFRI
jgi:hypothetical protein